MSKYEFWIKPYSNIKRRQHVVQEQVSLHVKKQNESRHNLIPSQRNYSTWITDLYIKCKTIELLENLDDLLFGDDMLDTASKARYMKEIMHKLDFTKLRNFSVKDTIKRMKR